MNKKRLEQLRLAKHAAKQHMAKQFFAKVPGAEEENSPDESGGDSPERPGILGDVHADGDASNLSPEQLHELMQMLDSKGNEEPSP